MKQRRHSQATISVLMTLLDHDQEVYGYGLTEATGLVSGSLYPILSRLEERGLLTSRWEQEAHGRPPRKLYKLTDEGRDEACAVQIAEMARKAAAEVAIAELRELREAQEVSEFVGGTI